MQDTFTTVKTKLGYTTLNRAACGPQVGHSCIKPSLSHGYGVGLFIRS